MPLIGLGPTGRRPLYHLHGIASDITLMLRLVTIAVFSPPVVTLPPREVFFRHVISRWTLRDGTQRAKL
jgi:hypothetical protein